MAPAKPSYSPVEAIQVCRHLYVNQSCTISILLPNYIRFYCNVCLYVRSYSHGTFEVQASAAD